MKTFRSLSEIQKYLEQNIQTVLDSSMQLESYLAHKMRDAVIEHVYSVYEPEVYERRHERGGLGLSDERNMSITSVDIIGNKVKVTFENLTEGDDSLKGEYISGLIEFGEGYDGKSWNDSDGDWAKPRPFTKKMAEDIIANPSELITLLKLELGNAGFKVK